MKSKLKELYYIVFELLEDYGLTVYRVHYNQDRYKIYDMDTDAALRIPGNNFDSVESSLQWFLANRRQIERTLCASYWIRDRYRKRK